MYAIIIWLYGEHITFVHNADGSIKQFEFICEADKEAEEYSQYRVISIEGVQE